MKAIPAGYCSIIWAKADADTQVNLKKAKTRWPLLFIHFLSPEKNSSGNVFPKFSKLNFRVRRRKSVSVFGFEIPHRRGKNF